MNGEEFNWILGWEKDNCVQVKIDRGGFDRCLDGIDGQCCDR